MKLIKKSMTRDEAAAVFLELMLRDALELWPDVRKMLAPYLAEVFSLPEGTACGIDEHCAFELALARIAIEYQSLRKEFPYDANHIETAVGRLFDEPNSEVARSRLAMYDAAWQRSVAAGSNAFFLIAELLLWNWTKNETVAASSGVQMIIVPVLDIDYVWVRFKKKYKLV